MFLADDVVVKSENFVRVSYSALFTWRDAEVEAEEGRKKEGRMREAERGRGRCEKNSKKEVEAHETNLIYFVSFISIHNLHQFLYRPISHHYHYHLIFLLILTLILFIS